jgi:hypothetical protein
MIYPNPVANKDGMNSMISEQFDSPMSSLNSSKDEA